MQEISNVDHKVVLVRLDRNPLGRFVISSHEYFKTRAAIGRQDRQESIVCVRACSKESPFRDALGGAVVQQSHDFYRAGEVRVKPEPRQTQRDCHQLYESQC